MSLVHRARQRHPRGWLLALAIALGAAACNSQPTRRTELPREPGAQESVEAIVGELVAVAELRADLSSMRVALRPVEEAEPPAAAYSARPASSAAESALIADELEGELVLALSNRVHLLDAGLAEAPAPELEGEEERFTERGATHVLVGEYERRGSDLVLTLRLVDARSRLIVAAARGEVPASGFARPRPTTASPRPFAPAQRSTPATAVAPAAVEEAEPAVAAATEASPPASETALATEPAAPAPPASRASAAKQHPSFEEWLRQREAQRAQAAGVEPEPLSEPAPEGAAGRAVEAASPPTASDAELIEWIDGRYGSRTSPPPREPVALPPAEEGADASARDREFIRRLLERYAGEDAPAGGADGKAKGEADGG